MFKMENTDTTIYWRFRNPDNDPSDWLEDTDSDSVPQALSHLGTVIEYKINEKVYTDATCVHLIELYSKIKMWNTLNNKNQQQLSELTI